MAGDSCWTGISDGGLNKPHLAYPAANVNRAGGTDPRRAGGLGSKSNRDQARISLCIRSQAEISGETWRKCDKIIFEQNRSQLQVN